MDEIVQDLNSSDSVILESISESSVGPNNSENEPIIELPDTAFLKLLKCLNLEDLKDCRLVCKAWNDIILSPQILPRVSCFIHDGRRDNQDGSNCETYLQQSKFGISIWSQMRLRRINFKQMHWLSHELTSTVTVLEINNCSLSWTNILLIMSELDNLTTFSDIQDTYCWDYSTFSEGLDNDEELEENESFKALPQDRLDKMQNLKHVRIHRSQFADCTIYLKMLTLRCNQLETLSVTTDQSLKPRPSGRFYLSVGQVIQRNAATLQTLCFPYRHIYPVYEFRITDDDTHPFRDFLNFVRLNNWGELIVPESLTELAIQFPVIHIEEALFKQMLLPFLESWTSLKKLFLNSVLLEVGKENILMESIPSHLTMKLGIWLSDNEVNGTIPTLDVLKDHFHTLTVQTWRTTWTQVTDVLKLEGGENTTGGYEGTTELQYFNKSPNFRNFNLDQLIRSFPNLTHLNLVDHNTRGERIHTCEALATIEDDDMQLILSNLNHLTFLQLNANMTYLTDSGITGLTQQACKRMFKTRSFVKKREDICGKSFLSMRNLRHIVLRGVGIKISDVSIYFGFYDMPKLRKLHVYGSQQVTPAGRMSLAQKFPTLKGCDVQI